MRVIAFFSQKGGCGKTTSCVNIAAALAEMGRRVLIVDLDSNACASRTFDRIVALDNSVAAALLGEKPLAEVIRPAGLPGLWLAPGATDLSTIEKTEGIRDRRRVTSSGRLNELALALELGELREATFDYVLLDCPGGHPFMGRAALLACGEVIIPTGLSVYDLYAATPTLQLILAAQQRRRDGRPAFLGFLPNGAGKAGVPRKMQGLLDIYAVPCFSPVRQSAALRSIAGMPRLEQRVMVLARPDSPAALSYRQVAREIELGPGAVRQTAAPLPSTEEAASREVGVDTEDQPSR